MSPIDKFGELVEGGQINKEWVARGLNIPKEMLEQLVNYGWIAKITYKKKSEDGYTNPKKFITLFVDPIII